MMHVTKQSGQIGDNMSESDSPFRGEPIDGGFRFSMDLLAKTAERQAKGASMGGDDSAPPPLAYFAASVAF